MTMSSQRVVDEETPLLQVRKDKRRKTPLPWGQFSIILLLLAAEPLTSQVISPFAPQLIRDIGIINGDETQVGYYVGLLHSLFFLMEALTVLHWSRLSDHIGRKPVLLTGLFGLSASMYCFGLSKTFFGLVMSRILNGTLNGNISVMKSATIEFTDSTNVAQAFAYMPIIWSSGATIAPWIGGSLAKPVDQFPDIFGDCELFKTYPYFLPCAVSATFTAIAWLVTFLYFRETLPRCVPLSQLVKAQFGSKDAAKATTPPVTNSSGGMATNENTEESGDDTPLPLQAIFVPRVLIAAGNYAMICLMDGAFRAAQPLFFSTPIELGGLGLDLPRIGDILSIYGALNGLFQIFVFPNLHDRLGSKVMYTIAIASCIPAFISFPLINALARTQGMSWIVWSLITVQLSLFILFGTGFPCMLLYVAAASPNRASLGATNGIAQLFASTMRAIGPVSVTSMFSISIETPERAWWVYHYLMFLIFVTLYASLWLPREVWKGLLD